MKVNLFPFQKTALNELRRSVAAASSTLRSTGRPQVISFTAPTGAGKTVIMASLIETVFFGDEFFPEQPNAVFVWLSDSPELNEQSKNKIETKSDKIRVGRCVTVTDDSIDLEVLEDGRIYFLNTQKLGKSSNLTKQSDTRQYTIWQTLANTAARKSDRFYVIIDEAHRGMTSGQGAAKATTIMQKFLRGSTGELPAPMPIVIGMSATIERFDTLVRGVLTARPYTVAVSPESVRASGLLKDKIVVSYPEEKTSNKDMAVLRAATENWLMMWDRWEQYCREQHYAYVKPVFVIQVLKSSSGDPAASDTDLGECLREIENRANFKFAEGEVVHTFGQHTTITANNLVIPYVEPSRISENRKIKVVFFKESLSTGWDCPRAETMMSFRTAVDATYIAQLLGRMVRTPLQMHIEVDEMLNEVRLFLPHFNETTVKSIIDELQAVEGGNIPAEIVSAGISQGELQFWGINDDTAEPPAHYEFYKGHSPLPPQQPESEFTLTSELQSPDNTAGAEHVADSVLQSKKPKRAPFNRREVLKAVNEMALLKYTVRKVRIENYLVSLCRLAGTLTKHHICDTLRRGVRAEIVQIIRSYVDKLKSEGKYEELARNAASIKLNSISFDAVSGKLYEDHAAPDLFSVSASDIELQFRRAEAILGKEGISDDYGHKYYCSYAPDAHKIDVILFVSDIAAMDSLAQYAEKRFNELHDRYRIRVARSKSERLHKEYETIVTNADIISKQIFRLPESPGLNAFQATDGKECRDHLYIDEKTGVARINLNSWEEGVLEEERKHPDYVCWIRNPARASWALNIPYKMSGETKPMYPDFLIVRKDPVNGYMVGILEPHDSSLKDNLNKAKGMAAYVEQNPGIERVQLIRKIKNKIGFERFVRLDLSITETRNKVKEAINNEELDHIFKTDGFSATDAEPKRTDIL